MQTTWLQAANMALREEMARDDSVVVMGEDVQAALFGLTAGLVTEFGQGPGEVGDGHGHAVPPPAGPAPSSGQQVDAHQTSSETTIVKSTVGSVVILAILFLAGRAGLLFWVSAAMTGYSVWWFFIKLTKR